jgi:hypothetical protein
MTPRRSTGSVIFDQLTPEFIAIVTMNEDYKTLHKGKHCSVIIKYLEYYFNVEGRKIFLKLRDYILGPGPTNEKYFKKYCKFYNWFSETPLEEIKSIVVLLSLGE